MSYLPFYGNMYLLSDFQLRQQMKKPSVTQVKKYLTGLSFFTKKKVKYVPAEKLSAQIGVYPEKINSDLSYFNPIITMDYTFNLLELIPDMEEFVNDDSNKKEVKIVKDVVTKKKLSEYDSITDFIYKKMSIGGMVNKNAELSDADLRTLKRLIMQETQNRKKKKGK